MISLSWILCQEKEINMIRFSNCLVCTDLFSFKFLIWTLVLHLKKKKTTTNQAVNYDSVLSFVKQVL